jgi:hypothetical protein
VTPQVSTRFVSRSIRRDPEWAVIAIHVWQRDAAVRDEFESVCDFCDWMIEVAEDLIRSASKSEMEA